jgi:hypothetical protein
MEDLLQQPTAPQFIAGKQFRGCPEAIPAPFPVSDAYCIESHFSLM